MDYGKSTISHYTISRGVIEVVLSSIQDARNRWIPIKCIVAYHETKKSLLPQRFNKRFITQCKDVKEISNFDILLKPFCKSWFIFVSNFLFIFSFHFWQIPRLKGNLKLSYKRIFKGLKIGEIWAEINKVYQRIALENDYIFFTPK